MSKKHIIYICCSVVSLLCGITIVLISIFGVPFWKTDVNASAGNTIADDMTVNDMGSLEVVDKISTLQSDEPEDKNAENVGTVYYIDAVSGSDLNDGLSPKTAYKSLARVNTIDIKPGTYILFKRGCVWNGGISVIGSGSKEKPAVIGMYGDDGDKPLKQMQQPMENMLHPAVAVLGLFDMGFDLGMIEIGAVVAHGSPS